MLNRSNDCPGVNIFFEKRIACALLWRKLCVYCRQIRWYRLNNTKKMLKVMGIIVIILCFVGWLGEALRDGANVK